MARDERLRAAVRLARKGFYVLPLHGLAVDGACTCGKECDTPAKHPHLAGWQNSASRDPGQAEAWFSRYFPAGNLGIATGRELPGGGFLAVLDADVRSGGTDSLAALEWELGALPETLTIRTPTGGLHLYYGTPEPMKKALGFRPGLDWLSSGAQVVAPPSTTPVGAYVVEKRLPIAEAPAALLALVSASRNGRGARLEQSELGEVLAGVGEGGRHGAGVKLAAHFLGKRHPPDVVELLLLDWNRKNTPPLPDAEVRRVVADLAATFEAKREAGGVSPFPPLPPERETPPLSDSGATAYPVSQYTPRETVPGNAPEGASRPPWRTLREVLEHPDALAPPMPIIPRLAWAGRSTLLAADPKGGKSTLCAAGVAALSTGRMFLGDTVPLGRALWVRAEGTLADTVANLQRFGADPDRILLLDYPSNISALARAIGELRPDVVVIETLTSVSSRISPAGAPASGDGSGWTRILATLTELCETTGAALVVQHHTRREDGKYRDSGAIAASVDVIYEMHTGEVANVRKLRAVGRWEVSPFSIALADDAYKLTAGELSMDARILAYVASDPGCSIRQLTKAVSGRAETVLAAAKRLLTLGTLEDRGDGVASQLHPVSRDRFPGAENEASGNTPVSRENPQGNATETPSGNGKAGVFPVSGGRGGNGETPPLRTLLFPGALRPVRRGRRRARNLFGLRAAAPLPPKASPAGRRILRYVQTDPGSAAGDVAAALHPTPHFRTVPGRLARLGAAGLLSEWQDGEAGPVLYTAA